MNKISNTVAIGNFDGVHYGHLKLLNNLKLIEKTKNKNTFVLTFDPHPKQVFNKNFKLLNTKNQKRELLKENGIKRIEFLSFNEIKDLTSECFVKNILIDRYNIDEIIVGHDFKFGKNKEGNVDILEQISKKYKICITIVSPVLVDSIRVSSSWIRTMIYAGKIDDSIVLKMLNRRYFIDGVIEKGFGIGKKIGFPTINLNSENNILPNGVFETRIKIEEKIYKSITNIGTRPTFNNKTETIETHIINFCKDLSNYKKNIRLFFVRKIRDEKKFKSTEELSEQINKDLKEIFYKKELKAL